MANTYTQLYLQFVYAVKFRGSLIQPTWKDELYKYTPEVRVSTKLYKRKTFMHPSRLMLVFKYLLERRKAYT